MLSFFFEETPKKKDVNKYILFKLKYFYKVTTF